VIKRYLFLLACLTSAVFSQSPIPAGAKLEKIAVGIQQPEGPVWIDSLGILFSDIAANKIYRFSPKDSLLTVFMSPSDSSNGLTLDLQGRLILTQMLLRRVSRRETNGTITPLVSTFKGKRFNSPNDVVVKSDSSIFFTDPDFNIPNHQKAELTFKGIYRISPSGGLTLLDSTLDKPNGICFSLDESKLYVNESAQAKIYVWDVAGDSITNKRLFYQVPASGYVDGMKIDPKGNIYCSGPNGVWIISPAGLYLDKISMETPSNCNWGDADRKTLYITAGNSLYRIRLASTTGVQDHGSLVPGSFKLYANYPNPFNPTTVISYQLAIKSLIEMKVYDSLGKQVATLVEGERPAGYYSVEWDAADCSSGTYFYQLKAGSFAQTRRMLLLK
jgi:gluconolactonase